MARTGLDKAEVKKAREQLLAEGRYPSADAVRIALGNTGSKSTIHKYLKELESADGKTDPRQARTAKTLQDMVDELAAQLHAEADTRLAALQAEHKAEMAALRQQVATLSFQLRQAETLARNLELAHDLQIEAAQEKSNRRFGFGALAGLLDNNRNGKPGWSAFTNLFDSRSATQADIPSTPGGADLLRLI